MTHLVLKDALLDAETLRVVGSAQWGGADIGECLATAARVKGTDLSSWYDEWNTTARTTFALASGEAEAGHTVNARTAFFRASSYFRTAGVMLMTSPMDSRLVESNVNQTTAFRRGAALLPTPPEVIEIPYENTTLPGYFYRVDADPKPRPTVILTGGYDGTCEELYFYNGAAALERGYNVLAFDGPGQGAALLQQHLWLRPDWEKVISAVVDFAVERADVDPARIALIGLSLGGYLAPRAASAEHRLAACIADCGSYDLYASALERIPKVLSRGFAAGRSRPTAILRRLLDYLAKKPTAGWALRRGQLVHGVASPLAYLKALPDYSLAGRAEHIRCPTFVCNAEGDEISASAPKLYAALTCEKKFVAFTAAEGADDHCESGARALYVACAFGWLDGILHPMS